MNVKKILPIIVAVAVVAGAGSFYGGMKYAGTKQSKTGQQRFQQMGGGHGLNRQTGGGFINGEIASKDDKSITVKLREGGSKIIFFSGTTEIGKSVTGAATDLEVGKTVMIGGQTNSDGSLTAQTIQIRPAAPHQPPAPPVK